MLRNNVEESEKTGLMHVHALFFRELGGSITVDGNMKNLSQVQDSLSPHSRVMEHISPTLKR